MRSEFPLAGAGWQYHSWQACSWTASGHAGSEKRIFHYEFEFLHPFPSGNGRLGRIWHTLILARWQPFFEWLPIETLIHERQKEYYKVLNLANEQGESTVFVRFMLEIVRDSLNEIALPETELAEDLEDRILMLLKTDSTLSAKRLASALNVSERHVQRMLQKLKQAGRLDRSGSNQSGRWIVR